MPSALTCAGAYVEEIPSGVWTITGVSTSNTGFVDYFRRGPMDEAVRITSYAESERIFGGIDARSEASYGTRHHYLNGGSVAFVVRVADGQPKKASFVLKDAEDKDSLRILASSESTTTRRWPPSRSTRRDMCRCSRRSRARCPNVPRARRTPRTGRARSGLGRAGQARSRRATTGPRRVARVLVVLVHYQDAAHLRCSTGQRRWLLVAVSIGVCG